MDKLIRRILLLSTQYKIDDIDTALIQNYIDSLNLHVIRNSSLKEITNSKSKEIWEIKTWLNQNQIKLDLDLLLKYYELQVSPQDRKKNGSYYTPNNVINFIIDRVVIDGVDKILDPACGSGAFLLGAAIKLKKFTKQTYKEIFDKYIYGVDIVPINVYRTKIILTLLALSSGEDEKNFNFNIYQGDSLAFDWEIYIKNFEGFKYIVGNPPYVRTKNLTREMRESLTRWSTTYLGNMDLYIPFFELGLSLLSKDGIMGYISPNTYFTSLNARVLRQLLKQKRVVKTIIDFDGLKIFKGATTYTGITILTARPNEYISFNLIDDYNLIDKLSELKPTHIRYEALGDDEWRLLSEKDLNNIRKIESVGSPLFKYAKRMITGIATLNNNLYLIDGNKKNGQYFLKTYKNKSYLIEKEVTRKIIKPNIIKSEAALAHNRERIIYPYISKDGKYELIPEETLKKQFPKTYEYFKVIKPLLDRRKAQLNNKGWYGYGRSQALDAFGRKIIFPMMADKPAFLYVDDPDTLIYCGYAIFLDPSDDPLVLTKILNSTVMWYYIKKVSKNYSGGFKSFAKNYVKNFSIPLLKKEEELAIRRFDSESVNDLLIKKYNLI